MANKLLVIYGEGGPSIGPSNTLVLDEEVWSKVMLKNINPEEVHTGLPNENVVD